MSPSEQQLLIESIGEKLKAARLRKKVTPSKAASETRIKVQLIEAMERDDFSGIPAAAYAKGFIKLYAEYLEMDPEPLVREYVEQHLTRKQEPDPQEEKKARKKSRKTSFLKRVEGDTDETKPARRIKFPKIRIPRISIPKISLPKIKLPKTKISREKVRKAVPVILAVAAVLVAYLGIRACTKVAANSASVTTVETKTPPKIQSGSALIQEPPEPYLTDGLLP